MTSSPASDVSLYELAINASPELQPLQLSPTTFKSIVSLFLDFLVEQNLPATIWMKLPRGEVWQAELDRFCQLTTAPYSIYNLQTYQQTTASPELEGKAVEPSQNGIRPVPPPVLSSVPSRSSVATTWDGTQLQTVATQIQPESFDDFWLDDGTDLPSTTLDSAKVQTLPLAVDSQLKREYFLLVATPSFYGLVIAHRPRTIRAEAAKLQGDDLDRKHPLLGVCSFDQAILQKVLEDGINAAICFGQSDAASSDNLKDLLLSWNDLRCQHSVATLDPALMGNLLVKQIQQQETLWRSSAVQRRQAEAWTEMQQENETLLTSLQQKDEFIKTIGLELRTPLSTMKTALSLLNSPSIKPPQRQRYMEMLSQECDRQGSLITSVLEIVQIENTAEQVVIEPLRLSDIVPGVVSTYQPLSQEKGVMLGYVVPEDLPPVACSLPWLRQIVINLLHNSIKFTPKGGQVWVRAKQQGEMIQLEFRDSGVGIASSDLPRIFERFYRVRGTAPNDSNGVGLGLSIVQQLLLRCGGSISVKSKQGEGSIFTVNLPVHQG
jgi:two-component system, OmpR family, phosphate regulon sensor histidine kinase PhoR